MAERLADMDAKIKSLPQDREHIGAVIQKWVDGLREALGLPEMLPVYELDSEMHTHVNPIEEARAIFGDDRLIVVEEKEKQ